jgi:hypothetical protein
MKKDKWWSRPTTNSIHIWTEAKERSAMRV